MIRTGSVALYSQERIGLAWMLERESRKTYPRGDILADHQICIRLSEMCFCLIVVCLQITNVG